MKTKTKKVSRLDTRNSTFSFVYKGTRLDRLKEQVARLQYENLAVEQRST